MWLLDCVVPVQMVTGVPSQDDSPLQSNTALSTRGDCLWSEITRVHVSPGPSSSSVSLALPQPAVPQPPCIPEWRGRLLNTDGGPYTQSFWYGRSLMGPENLHVWVPRWYWCCWSGDRTWKTTGPVTASTQMLPLLQIPISMQTHLAGCPLGRSSV